MQVFGSGLGSVLLRHTPVLKLMLQLLQEKHDFYHLLRKGLVTLLRVSASPDLELCEQTFQFIELIHICLDRFSKGFF